MYVGLLVAWSPFAYLAATHGDIIDWVQRPTLSAFLQFHAWSFSFFSPSTISSRAFTLALLACIGLAQWGSASTIRGARPVFVWFYASTLPIFAVSLVLKPIWMNRYFTSYAPALFILVGIGLVRLFQRARWAAALAGAFILGWQLAGLRYLSAVDEDWRAAAAYVGASAKKTDRIAVIGVGSDPLNVWSYYAHDAAPGIPITDLHDFARPTASAPGSHLWIVARVSGHEDRPARIREALEDSYRIRSETFPGIEVFDAERRRSD